MRRPPNRSMRRSPATKSEKPDPHVAAVRPREVTAGLSTNSRSSSGRLHSSLGNVLPRAYRTPAGVTFRNLPDPRLGVYSQHEPLTWLNLSDSHLRGFLSRFSQPKDVIASMSSPTNGVPNIVATAPRAATA